MLAYLSDSEALPGRSDSIIQVSGHLYVSTGMPAGVQVQHSSLVLNYFGYILVPHGLVYIRLPLERTATNVNLLPRCFLVSHGLFLIP